MKNAHFIDTDVVGGAETLVVELCRKLKNHEIEPEIIHFDNPWIKEKCVEHQIPTAVVPHHNLYKSIKTLPLFSLTFSNFLKKRKIDILHSHLVDPVAGASLAAFISRTPHIGTLHDTHTLQERPVKLRLIQIAAFLGTRIVTVSKDVENYVRNNINSSRDSYQTIYNGVDLDKFVVPRKTSFEMRKQLGIKENDIAFICVGRLAPIKGHEVLIRAFAEIKSRDNIKLLIAGDGPCRESIEGLISRHNLQNTVKMLGERHDVPELLNASDCFVLSSHSEGLSCSIIEAMASGLPVIATNVGGNHELVKDGLSGFLVPPSDPVSFADKIDFFANKVDSRKKMGKESQRITQQKFSLDSMVENYLKLYEDVSQKKGKQAE